VGQKEEVKRTLGKHDVLRGAVAGARKVLPRVRVEPVNHGRRQLVGEEQADGTGKELERERERCVSNGSAHDEIEAGNASRMQRTGGGPTKREHPRARGATLGERSCP
jgi:hypothetical protein